MADSENESRAAAVGRKRIRTGESGSYAIAPATAPSSRASSAESATSSKESGEISRSSNGSQRSSRQSQHHPQDSDDDQGDNSDSGGSETDTSSETDDSDDEPPAHSMASPEGQAHHPDTSGAKSSQGHEDEELHLKEEAEERKQLLYFHYDKRKDMKDFVVRCFCCGAKGHARDDCPERYCKHCGAFEEHASHACPQGRKCGRCRQRGHDSRDCTNPTKLPNTIAGACDICGELGHVEEECMKLWVTGPEPPTTRPVRRIWKVCYNCGAQGYDHKGHWGDDCPDPDRPTPDGLGRQIKTWSAQHANQFIDPDVEDSYSEYSEDEDKSRSEDNPSNDSRYDPMADLEDFVNDQASKKRSETTAKEKAEEIQDGHEIKENTPTPTKPTWQMALLDDARD